jgi:AcrR family transcriptional regulator
VGRPPRIRTEQILEAARRIFTARGFAAATLAEVAAELEVTPAAILRYFPSKEALFAEAMSTRGIPVPDFVDDLARVDAAEDPRVVLRRFAEQLIPFMRAVIRPAIAVHMHAARTTLTVPFDAHAPETPPRRGIRALTSYFRRAMQAGVIRKGDPRASALLFVGQLQAYVFIHEVLGVTPVHPLDKYLDALLDLWERGAIVGGSREESDPRAGRRRGRGRDAAVPAPAEETEAARPRRNARGADGERGIAGRRPRHARPRR